MFNKKLWQQIKLINSDIFEFHRWFAGIKTNLAKVEVASYNHKLQLEDLRKELATPKSGQTWLVRYMNKEYLGFYSYYKGELSFHPNVPNEMPKPFLQSDIKPIKQL